VGMFSGGGIKAGIQSEEETAIAALFPASNKFNMKQMITELQPKATTSFSVLGVFRRLYKSRTLTWFQDEYNSNKIAQERKGRLELSEVVAAGKKMRPDDND